MTVAASSQESTWPVAPVTVSSDLGEWTEKLPLMFRIGRRWYRHAPRAKGYVPHRIGQVFGKRWRCVVRTALGTRLAVDPANLEVYVTISSGGLWEPQVVRTCLALLKPGDAFYDIGANVGYISTAVGAHFKGQVPVIAFEPQPRLAQHVAISARLNNLTNLQVYPMMLGDRAGAADLFTDDNCAHASAAPIPGAACGRIQCPVRRLDDHIASAGLPPPSLIKIDVEGAEPVVFQGARETLTRHHPFIVFELNGYSERFGFSRQEVLDLLGSFGYREFLGIHERGLQAFTSLEQSTCFDMVAVPPGVSARSLLEQAG